VRVAGCVAYVQVPIPAAIRERFGQHARRQGLLFAGQMALRLATPAWEELDGQDAHGALRHR
jgi:hypothetical protein